jgi:hypothetical protein
MTHAPHAVDQPARRVVGGGEEVRLGDGDPQVGICRRANHTRS